MIILCTTSDRRTRATGAWTSPVKEASSGESGHFECWDDDGKRKGVGRHDGKEEGWSVVCVGDEMEGEQSEIVGRKLKIGP